MHTAALRALRVDALYAPFDLPPRYLKPMVEALVLSGVEGFSVTVPHKEAVLPLMDRLDASAKAIGAVNTVVVRGRRLTGYNTDGTGFRRALEELGWRWRRPSRDSARDGRPELVEGRPQLAIVLGAGGAARAVAWELAQVPGMRLVIGNRTSARAAALARWIASKRRSVRVASAPLAQLPLEAADLLVNATTVGMKAGDRLLADARRLPETALVYDLVYNRRTALLDAARRRGCVASGGLSMLLYQGAEALRLWLHRPFDSAQGGVPSGVEGHRAIPLNVMRAALTRALHSST